MHDSVLATEMGREVTEELGSYSIMLPNLYKSLTYARQHVKSGSI